MLTAQPMATSSILVRPTFHPMGSMMLNRMITTKVKPACPAANEIMDGATPDTSTAKGRSDPQEHRVVGDADHHGGAHHEAHRRPSDRPQGRGAGAQGIGPQYRQRTEDHPKAMLDVGDLDAPPPPVPGLRPPARHCGTRRSGTRGARVSRRQKRLAVGSIGRRPAVRSPDRLGPSSFERRVGRHFGGDAQGPGLEAGVQR